MSKGSNSLLEKESICWLLTLSVMHLITHITDYYRKSVKREKAPRDSLQLKADLGLKCEKVTNVTVCHSVLYSMALPGKVKRQ